MRSLVAKELRALVPMMILCFLVISGDLLFRPFTERLDEASWQSISSIESGDGGGMAFMFALLAFFVAYAAFPREHDEGTIAYLGSLPVTPARIFAAKVGAGLLVLIAFPMIGQLTNWILQLPNPQSFSGNQFRAEVAITAGALQAIFASIVYGHALLASSLRRFGLLPYALAVWVLVALEEIAPELAWVSPASICRFEYEGTRLTIPWLPIVVHSIVSAIAIALAYFAWMGPFDRLRELAAPKKEGRSLPATLALGCATSIIGVLVFALLIFVSLREAERGVLDPPSEGVSWQTAEVRSARYAFVYPTNLRGRATRLAGAADAILERVIAVTGAEDPGLITVDLAESSGHHEGIAAGTRIRMGLLQDDENRLRHVLAHESTHVIQGRESDRRLADHGAITRFFVEGSAEWVAYEVVSDLEDERRQSRIVAAASWSRHELDLEDVLDDARLRERYDTTLVYSLGETWADAIASACGRAAIGGVIRAIGRADAPDDPGALGIWQDALQHAGCSEAAVRLRWERAMRDLVESERDAIAAIPRAGAGVVGAGGERTVIVAELDRPAPPGAEWWVRVRRDRAASDTEVRGARGALEDAVHVRFELARELTYPRFDLEVCMIPEGGNWPFCEPWQSATP